MSDKRFDDPGRNGLGKFTTLNFALVDTAPREATSEEVPAKKSGLGPDAFRRLIAPTYVSPEQAISLFSMGAVVLVASIGFWLFIYFRSADEFHVPQQAAVPEQTRIAQELEAARLKRHKQ